VIWGLKCVDRGGTAQAAAASGIAAIGCGGGCSGRGSVSYNAAGANTGLRYEYSRRFR
jgi:hypothetical protein